MPSIDKSDSVSQPTTAGTPLSIRELTTVLIKHYELHEGHFDLSIEFNIGVGAVGPDPNALSPGAIIGVSRIGLTHSENPNPMSINAEIVNPAKKPRKKLTKDK